MSLLPLENMKIFMVKLHFEIVDITSAEDDSSSSSGNAVLIHSFVFCSILSFYQVMSSNYCFCLQMGFNFIHYRKQ